MKSIRKIIVALLCLIAVTGCEQSKPCVDADDFGYPKVKLYGKGIDVEGITDSQVSKWQDSGLVIDGSQIIFDVYGRWFPWLEGDASVANDPCHYDLNITYPYSTGASDDSGIKVNKYSQPCWLTKGMGVYGLTVKTDASGDWNLSVTHTFDPSKDPNQNMATRRSPPNANTFHMGDPDISDLYPTRTFDLDSDPGGGPVKQGVRVGTFDMLGKAGKTMVGDRLYFKILDTFYADNGGSVVVKIRSGARSPYPGVFEKLINAVSDILLGSAEIIFRQLLDPSRSDIPRAIQALLILYIAIYGLYYLMGMISPDTTQAVFLTKIVKFAIVAALLSSTSFEFFYDYLLVLFVEGMKETINIVSGPFLTGSAHATDRMTFFDDVFRKLFSEETNIKIASLMWFPNPTNRWVGSLNVKGLIYIPVLYIFIAFFAIALLKALLVYLMTLIALGMLIALAPILIPFMLFSRTKEMYEGWLKALIGTAIQPVLLFGFLTLMYVILLECLYKTLGYRVCWNTWWSGSLFGPNSIVDIVDADSNKNDLKAWMPNIRNKWDSILVPPFFYSTYSVGGCGPAGTLNVGPGGGDVFLDIDCSKVGEHCRLVDYPGLVPPNAENCPGAGAETNDPNDELQLSRALSGTVTSFEDIFFFGVTIFLMFLFSDKVPQMARDIAGLTHGAALESAAGGLWSNVKAIGSNPLGVRSLGQAAFSRARKEAGIGSLTKGFRNWQDKVGGAYDKGKERLEKGAKRKAMQLTGTYGLYKAIEGDKAAGTKGLRGEGKATIKGAQDAIGSRLEKVGKYTGLDAPAKIPLTIADKLAVKGIEKGTGKKIGTLDPRALALKGVEKAGGLGGKLYGTIAYGIPKKKDDAAARKLLTGGSAEDMKDLQKQSLGLQKQIQRLELSKDKDKQTKLDKLNDDLQFVKQQQAEALEGAKRHETAAQRREGLAKAEGELRTKLGTLDPVKDHAEYVKVSQDLRQIEGTHVTTLAGLEQRHNELAKQVEQLGDLKNERNAAVHAELMKDLVAVENRINQVEAQREVQAKTLAAVETDVKLELAAQEKQKEQEKREAVEKQTQTDVEVQDRLQKQREKEEREKVELDKSTDQRAKDEAAKQKALDDEEARAKAQRQQQEARDAEARQREQREQDLRNKQSSPIDDRMAKLSEDREREMRDKQVKKIEADRAINQLQGEINRIKGKGDMNPQDKADLERLTREMEKVKKDLNQ